MPSITSQTFGSGAEMDHRNIREAIKYKKL